MDLRPEGELEIPSQVFGLFGCDGQLPWKLKSEESGNGRFEKSAICRESPRPKHTLGLSPPHSLGVSPPMQRYSVLPWCSAMARCSSFASSSFVD
jgi:hypothetical protein